MPEPTPDPADLASALPSGAPDQDLAKPLDDDEKLDIALKDSMLTSEPPQITEPKQAKDDRA